MPNNEKNHWENIYKTKQEREVSWYQPYPKTSMDFINSFNLPLNASIIDAGAGDGYLIEALIDKGYTNIWALDISDAAIEKAKLRLGKKASLVNWIASDILEFKTAVQYDLWHDRAVFHFLTTTDQISQYVSIAEKAIRQNGYMVIGTFSEQGPKKCSGLNIKQYSEDSMPAALGTSFQKIRCMQEDHVTPFNTQQNFLFCGFQRMKSSGKSDDLN